MAYDWRSPSWFESLGVGVAPLGPPFVNDTTARHPGALRARPDVPFLMLQGGQDHVIGASQACVLSEAMGSSCNNWYVDTDASGMTSINSWCPAAAYPSLASWNPGPADLTQAKHNLVWITGDNHAGEASGRGILYDYVAWEYFRAFVAGLGWGFGWLRWAGHRSRRPRLRDVLRAERATFPLICVCASTRVAPGRRRRQG